MRWKRSKAATAVLPAEPSLGRWLLAGVIAAVVGMMLFLLHASGMANVLTVFNIWWLSLSPVLGWFFLFCLRGWLWGRAVDEHQFLHKEARYGQQQWERWAGRYVAVLGSSILLPSGVTAKAIAKASTAEAESFLSRVCHFGAEPPVTVAYLLKQGIASVQHAVSILPDSVPLNVTVVTDCIAGGEEALFREAWGSVFPERAQPASVSFCGFFSFSWVAERLKQPVLDIDLILVLQNNGAEQYSDALASVLLASDDVAEKFQLPHSARILRPMPLDMANFKADIGLFLETQTTACQAPNVFCDTSQWHERFPDVMTAGFTYQASWEPQETDVMEKYSGIPGTGSAWLLAALLSDIVSVNKTSVLGLFTSGSDHFISTVISGSENNDTE